MVDINSSSKQQQETRSRKLKQQAVNSNSKQQTVPLDQHK